MGLESLQFEEFSWESGRKLDYQEGTAEFRRSIDVLKSRICETAEVILGLDGVSPDFGLGRGLGKEELLVLIENSMTEMEGLICSLDYCTYQDFRDVYQLRNYGEELGNVVAYVAKLQELGQAEGEVEDVLRSIGQQKKRIHGWFSLAVRSHIYFLVDTVFLGEKAGDSTAKLGALCLGEERFEYLKKVSEELEDLMGQKFAEWKGPEGLDKLYSDNRRRLVFDLDCRDWGEFEKIDGLSGFIGEELVAKTRKELLVGFVEDFIVTISEGMRDLEEDDYLMRRFRNIAYLGDGKDAELLMLTMFLENYIPEEEDIRANLERIFEEGGIDYDLKGRDESRFEELGKELTVRLFRGGSEKIREFILNYVIIKFDDYDFIFEAIEEVLENEEADFKDELNFCLLYRSFDRYDVKVMGKFLDYVEAGYFVLNEDERFRLVDLLLNIGEVDEDVVERVAGILGVSVGDLRIAMEGAQDLMGDAREVYLEDIEMRFMTKMEEFEFMVQMGRVKDLGSFLELLLDYNYEFPLEMNFAQRFAEFSPMLEMREEIEARLPMAAEMYPDFYYYPRMVEGLGRERFFWDPMSVRLISNLGELGIYEFMTDLVINLEREDFWTEEVFEPLLDFLRMTDSYFEGVEMGEPEATEVEGFICGLQVLAEVDKRFDGAEHDAYGVFRNKGLISFLARNPGRWRELNDIPWAELVEFSSLAKDCRSYKLAMLVDFWGSDEEMAVKLEKWKVLMNFDLGVENCLGWLKNNCGYDNELMRVKVGILIGELSVEHAWQNIIVRLISSQDSRLGITRDNEEDSWNERLVEACQTKSERLKRFDEWYGEQCDEMKNLVDGKKVASFVLCSEGDINDLYGLTAAFDGMLEMIRASIPLHVLQEKLFAGEGLKLAAERLKLVFAEEMAHGERLLELCKQILGGELERCKSEYKVSCSEGESVAFCELGAKEKKEAFSKLTLEVIGHGQEVERKKVADDFNRRNWSEVKLMEGGEDLHCGKVDDLCSVLRYGNLARELHSAAVADKDFFPFHTDCARVPVEWEGRELKDIAKFKLIEWSDFDFFSKYGRDGRLGEDGQIVYCYRKEFLEWEADRECLAFRRGGKTNHSLYLAGLPSTELDSVWVVNAEESLRVVVDAILNNGFYIPVYDLETGRLLFRPEDFDRIWREDNYGEKLEYWEGVWSLPKEKGMNPGAVFLKNEDGGLKRFYGKSGELGDGGKVVNEVLADRIYRRFGLGVAESKVVLRDGCYWRISEEINGMISQAMNGEGLEPEVEELWGEGAIIDVWLGNWDGLSKKENIMSEGKLYRFDNGGALIYHAANARQGSRDCNVRKDEVDFSGIVTEMEPTQRFDKHIYGFRNYFGGLSEDDLAEQVLRLGEIFSDEVIDEMVDGMERMKKSDRERVKSVLKKRRDYLVKGWGGGRY